MEMETINGYTSAIILNEMNITDLAVTDDLHGMFCGNGFSRIRNKVNWVE